MSTPPRIVVAPDSFKGTVPAREVAERVRRGLLRALPGAEVVALPVADGGEGTLEALAAGGAALQDAEVSGPLGRPVRARWARTGDGAGGATAYVESAQAAGLALLDPGPATALAATTRGVGELVLAALDAGCTALVLGLGGTSTTDGGAGLARALGARLLDADGHEVREEGGGALHRVAAVDRAGLHPRLAGLTVTVACDVDNPLLGEHGAAAVFAPQKGAGPDEVRRLEEGLRAWSTALAPDLVDRPGAGAAGGLAFAAAALLGARSASGAELVMDLLGLDEAVRGAHLVVVGEGSLDAQSLRGKAPLAVAARARSAGAVVAAVAGRVALDEAALRAAGIERALSLVDAAGSAGRASADGPTLLEQQGEALGRWWRERTP
ncbi:glycerate kinase [Vallicoccus soli]|uniref:Glycerate kinase n=1 Tax=Vallicoccus soli TaxID=2339232 RepID=A0A3A3Z133_9ACTN|nr:glycerate kinase [Vallicoccus soli]RJK96955.1 glycerate kinase [Vallicoccus soli]